MHIWSEENYLEVLKVGTDRMFVLVMGCLIFCEYIYNYVFMV